jgi:hypothetical protein
MRELLLPQASSLSMTARGRPVTRLAWNYVDLDVTTLLSFERPPLEAVTSHAGASGAHLENSIVATHVFFSIKRTRAHGGCLGAKSR